MKDLVANLSISCRSDLVGSEHETQEDERRLVGDATVEKSRSKDEATTSTSMPATQDATERT